MNSPKLFHRTALQQIKIVDGLMSQIGAPSYAFMAPDEFEVLCKTEVASAMDVYWREMLGRVHLTAATSMKRARKWIAGISCAIEEQNLLLFAAAMRGWIEAAADATTGLIRAPITLARLRSNILGALRGDCSGPFLLCEALEDDLIHFNYARKIGRNQPAPSSHHAQTVRDYLQILEGAKINGILDSYSWLCDLTHPGASSVWMWLQKRSECEVGLVESSDQNIIAAFIDERQSMILDLVMYSFNPALVALRVLNRFPVPQLHTPILESWDMSGVPAWAKIQSDLQ